MDMFDCGIYSFVNSITIETIRFWAKNSYEHIDVLLNSAEPNGAILQESFEDEMKRLFTSFQSIYNDLGEVKRDTNVYYMVKRFLSVNDHLIALLERLKFEGYNGFPILYEATYHFLYEQMYVKEIFKPLMYTRDVHPQDVVMHASFRRMGLGTNPLQCIYGQIYFWSMIGAEHPSLVMNVAPDEMKQLPKSTVKEFKHITNRFNNVAYALSSIYPKLNNQNLLAVLEDLRVLNRDFLNFLSNFKNNPQYLPPFLKRQLPELFFGVLEHIIDEHQYVEALVKKIMKSQYNQDV